MQAAIGFLRYGCRQERSSGCSSDSNKDRVETGERRNGDTTKKRIMQKRSGVRLLLYLFFFFVFFRVIVLALVVMLLLLLLLLYSFNFCTLPMLLVFLAFFNFSSISLVLFYVLLCLLKSIFHESASTAGVAAPVAVITDVAPGCRCWQSLVSAALFFLLLLGSRCLILPSMLLSQVQTRVSCILIPFIHPALYSYHPSLRPALFFSTPLLPNSAASSWLTVLQHSMMVLILRLLFVLLSLVALRLPLGK